MSLPNITLIALTASYCCQVGAGFFALSVVGRVITAAPPRSLAMLQGAYRYDSSAFWQIAPAITAVALLLALVANWRTQRRGLLLVVLALFVLSGLLTGVVLSPMFDAFASGGYRDVVDAELQRRAATWYAADWGLRCVDAVSALALLVALTRPALPHGASVDSARRV